MREDKIRLEIFKNELRTKQKAIESMRYNYLKADNLAEKGEFMKSSVQINQPPKSNLLNQAHQRGPSSYLPSTSSHQAPRFSYEDYMRNLTSKLQSTPNAGTYMSGSGADFQAYLLREREQYVRSMNDVNKDQPLIDSLTVMAR